MSHASSSKVCKYGVFLSFRGIDTRRNFVSHLYNALEQRGIDVFKDDERLETGKSIPNELMKAIEESRFAIVIFSESYASSRWCLEELAHIIKCRNELDQIVIPIFYDVSPSDVSHQNSPFAESFSKYKDDELEKVQRWREACKEAGKISGYHLQECKYHSFEMHSLISQTGQNVSREEYANSRVWLIEEVHDLFAGKLKTKKVESLRIPNGYRFDDDHINYNKVFKRMQCLQVLILHRRTICSESTVTCLPSNLRWIEWPNYPSSSLPEGFEPSQLVGLCLRGSWLVELWPIPKKLCNLKYLNLSESLGLTKTPNFGDMPNLETLSLRRCENLEVVHPYLGHCKMLTYLSLTGCVKLKKLPKFVCMESLEILLLDECTSLKRFPKICGDMRRLSILYVESPWIRSLPPSLSGLSRLKLKGCEVLESIPDSILNLERLHISGCNKLTTLPNSLFESQQWIFLYIYRCSGLVELPVSLGVQKKLGFLSVEECENLTKLPSSIQMESLTELKISNCPKLTTFPEIIGDMHCLKSLTLESTGIRELPLSIGNLSGLEYLNLKGCEDLVSLSNSLCKLKNLQRLILRGCKKLPGNVGDLQEFETLEEPRRSSK
uniref:Nematode resistance protein n=1 Tax=Solanum tuberosum TaxID=4113 RepID=M1CVI3_SOLTU